MKEIAKIVAHHFLAHVSRVTSLGAGRINDTYLATDGLISIVLRRINPSVFPEPQVVVKNFSLITEHFSLYQHDHCFWPQALPTMNGKQWYEDENGDVWHAQRYFGITDSADDKLRDPKAIYACGACLARFHEVAAQGACLKLQEPLENFHSLPFYLHQYDQYHATLLAAEEIQCQRYIADNRSKVVEFSSMNESGLLGKTIIHGDPKADNFVFAGKLIGLIDLDTAYFNSIHIDIGDALRSFCNPVGEDGGEPQFDLAIFEGFILGYMSVQGEVLSSLQKEKIYDAVFALSFELGLRFFSDHLAGDRYFKVARPGENLSRAMVQFQLCQKIEDHQNQIMAILKRV